PAERQVVRSPSRRSVIRPFKQFEPLSWFLPNGFHLLERPVGGREFFHHSTLRFGYRLCRDPARSRSALTSAPTRPPRPAGLGGRGVLLKSLPSILSIERRLGCNHSSAPVGAAPMRLDGSRRPARERCVVYYSNCGAQLYEGANFCPDCGQLRSN